MDTNEVCRPRQSHHVGDSLIQSVYVVEPMNDEIMYMTIAPPLVMDVVFGGVFTQLIGIGDEGATFSCRVLRLHRSGMSSRAELAISRTDGKKGWGQSLSLLALWTVIHESKMPLSQLIE